MEGTLNNISKYNSENFISEINKIIKLKENNIFSEEEYLKRKNDILDDIKNKGITQNLTEFLSDILVLKEKDILTVEEINNIKTSLAQKKDTIEPIYTPESEVLANNRKTETKKANGLVSRILTLLLTLLFFLPWFTFRACNVTYDYNGYSTIAFQPSNDVSNFSDKISELGSKLSEKTGSKESKTDKFNDFFIISIISAIIGILLIILILISYYSFNVKSVTILSSIMSILFIAIIVILLIDKSKISSEAKGMVDISINFGLFLCLLTSIIIVFSKKIEMGLIIRDNESNSMLFKLNKFFNNKFIGLIGIGIMIICILLSLFIYTSSGAETKTDANKKFEQLKTETTQPQENKSLSENNSYNDTKNFSSNLNTPDGVVVKFINSLGSQDFSSAYYLMTEKRRGSYSLFSSTRAYGGITSTKIFECSYEGETNGKKEVLVDYESIDPANKSGRFKQYFYLIPSGNSYLISDIKNINIEWY